MPSMELFLSDCRRVETLASLCSHICCACCCIFRAGDDSGGNFQLAKEEFRRFNLFATEGASNSGTVDWNLLDSGDYLPDVWIDKVDHDNSSFRCIATTACGRF